jgi:hypothetical protein
MFTAFQILKEISSRFFNRSLCCVARSAWAGAFGARAIQNWTIHTGAVKAGAMMRFLAAAPTKTTAPAVQLRNSGSIGSGPTGSGSSGTGSYRWLVKSMLLIIVVIVADTIQVMDGVSEKITD